MTEKDTSPLAGAYQAIGAYFCSFSRVEHELGESFKAGYGLQNNDASDAIVAALGDVARKTNLVWAASKGAKNAQGEEASAEWKAKVEARVKSVFNCNDDRVLLAHSLLGPKADGSVDLVRLKVTGGKVTGKDAIKWSSDDFLSKTKQMDELVGESKSLNGELRNFKYTIPNFGWIPSSNFLDMMARPIPPLALRALLLQQNVPAVDTETRPSSHD